MSKPTTFQCTNRLVNLPGGESRQCPNPAQYWLSLREADGEIGTAYLCQPCRDEHVSPARFNECEILDDVLLSDGVTPAHTIATVGAQVELVAGELTTALKTKANKFADVNDTKALEIIIRTTEGLLDDARARLLQLKTK